MKIYLTLFIFLIYWLNFSQINCQSVSIEPNNTSTQLLTFDNLSSYNSGVIINNVARIKVRVEDQTPSTTNCTWNLKIFIENSSGGGTPSDEWEQLFLYGNGNSNNPKIDILQIRVRNICGTSPANNIFRNFDNTTDVLDIISENLPLTSAGSCSQNVNGPGNYLSNYDEFTFDIDIKLIPGINTNPGVYNLNLRFRLAENL